MTQSARPDRLSDRLRYLGNSWSIEIARYDLSGYLKFANPNTACLGYETPSVPIRPGRGYFRGYFRRLADQPIDSKGNMIVAASTITEFSRS